MSSSQRSKDRSKRAKSDTAIYVYGVVPADVEVQKNSKGDVRESTERGRLPKLLDFLNPF